INFIENAEWARFGAKHRQQQGDRGERLLAARQQGKRAQLLARRPSDDFDAAFEHIGFVFEQDVGATAAKKLPEQLAKMAAHRIERFHEETLAVLVDLLDDLVERRFALVQIDQLGAEHRGASLEFFEFRERLKVDIAQAGNLAAQFLDLTLYS